LTWTQHRAIMRVADPKARAYYLREAEDWNTRGLERPIRTFAHDARTIGILLGTETDGPEVEYSIMARSGGLTGVGEGFTIETWF